MNMRKIKMLVGLVFVVLGFQTVTFAVERCDGIYSPGNPFLCRKSGTTIDGNCVWLAWHWLRYGKGHRTPKFTSSANYWGTDGVRYGYTVNTNPKVGSIAVSETKTHVAVVMSFDSQKMVVWEMNWGLTGQRTKTYYFNSQTGRYWEFNKYVHPHPQPTLSRILPSQIYKATYDQNFILEGENLDKVAKLEITFPNGGLGTLSGIYQIPWKNYNQLGFFAKFGTSGRYVINAITDKNVESIPQMPFTVY